MVEHKCEKCGRIFNRIDSYRIHINRKYSCAPNLDKFERMEKRITELENKIESMRNTFSKLEDKKNRFNKDTSFLYRRYTI